MSRWGLRWIFCWLSVFITACTQSISPSQTNEPENLTPIDRFSPTVTASFTRSPTRDATATSYLVTNVPQPPIHISSPRCFATPAESLVCLGWLQNESLNQQYVLPSMVQLFEQLGTSQILLDNQPLLASLNVIPAQLQVPYRVIFTNVSRPVGSVVARPLTPDESRRLPVDANVVLLDVPNIQATWQGRDYRVSGRISNPTTNAVNDIRIVATIIDASEETTGFRVLRLSEILLAGDESSFSLRVAPLNGIEGERVSIWAQGMQVPGP